MRVVDAPQKAKGFQQLTSLAASTALTVPAGALYAMIQAEVADVRWRPDAVAPTTAIGMILEGVTAPVPSQWYTAKLADLRFIEVAVGAKLNVSYFA